MLQAVLGCISMARVGFVAQKEMGSSKKVTDMQTKKTNKEKKETKKKKKKMKMKKKKRKEKQREKRGRR